MSFLEPFVNWDNGCAHFSREQSSRFAKEVADDYNPIHDVAAKRFCVPGDLLFAVLLTRKGLHPRMMFTFSGMVGDGVPLHFQEDEPGNLRLEDQRGKEYLRASFEGEANHDAVLLEEVIRSYVQFSGHNFPQLLQPLMAKHEVMINIDRPLVIYESMSLDLHTVDLKHLQVEFESNEMQVVGKRGNASLRFRFMENGNLVGYGEKKMVLSGLRPYDEEQMQQMIDLYNARKADKVV